MWPETWLLKVSLARQLTTRGKDACPFLKLGFTGGNNDIPAEKIKRCGKKEKKKKTMSTLKATKTMWHTQAASQTSFFTRHTFFIVWVLNFTYIGRVRNNDSFLLSGDAFIAMKICWHVTCFLPFPFLRDNEF